MVGGHEKLGTGPPFLPGSLLYCTDTTVLSGTVGTVHPEHLRRATHMAKQTTVTLVDDLDGKKADEQEQVALADDADPEWARSMVGRVQLSDDRQNSELASPSSRVL